MNWCASDLMRANHTPAPWVCAMIGGVGWGWGMRFSCHVILGACLWTCVTVIALRTCDGGNEGCDIFVGKSVGEGGEE
jgi:hypothetical protein